MIPDHWAGLVPAKIRLIFANHIPSKKREGGWTGLVPAKIRLILANDVSSKKFN